MTGKELYNLAKKHIGQGGAVFRRYCGLSSNAAYCNAYVCYIFNEGGVRNLFYGGKKVTYCPTSIKWCEAHLAQIPPYIAMPMDIIYFDWQPNGRPDHIGFVKARYTTDKIFTHEGNTSGGKVAEKTRPMKYVQGIFRPHFKPTGVKKCKLSCDGQFGYVSIYNLQCALGLKASGILGKGTVKALQKKAGATPDGAWGRKTSIAVQKMVGAVKDGEFGKNSVIALQKWINKVNYPSAVKKPAAAKKPAVKKPAPKPVAKKPAAPQPSAKAKAAVAWARKIAKDGSYTYKHWNNKDKKSKQCPICHKLKGKYKGWNCIGFVSAAFHHGAGLKQIECSCKGIGTDNFFTKVSENAWIKRNGPGWKMIRVGARNGKDIPASKLLAGDVLICYDGKGKFHHIALYTGSGKYIDCTNTSKHHIAERSYKDRLCERYHVTRAFRYVG